MNRIVVTFQLLLFLLAPILARAQILQAPQVVETIDSPTILRSGPSENYDRIAELPKGLRFSVESTQTNWSKVRVSKLVAGWIDSKSLQQTPDPVSAPVIRYIKIKREENDVRMEILESEPSVVLAEEWLKPPVLWLKFQNSRSALSEVDYDPKDPIIFHVSVLQSSEDIVSMKIDLKAFHGYQIIQKDPTHLIVKFPLRRGGCPRMGTVPSLKGWTICLDPGHGGKDTGAIGPNGLQEKEVTLAVSKLLAQLLNSRGAHVIFTRTTDTDITDPTAPDADQLEKRVEIARADETKLFISIHCNARPTATEGRQARGSYVYYYQPQSFALARAVSTDLEKQLEEPKYGVIFRSFHVIRETDFPAILIETVFISNPMIETKLRSTSYQEKIAHGIFNGILAYIKTL